VIACLPLAEGYTATYRNFDALQTQKVKLLQLTFPAWNPYRAAGKFDAYRVEITSAMARGQADGLGGQGFS